VHDLELIILEYIQKGTASFRKVALALFAGGFSTFAILYCTQPLMPEFSRDFEVSPTVASLALSGTTITLAISMLLVGTLSEAWGRKPVMTFSLFGASALALLIAFVPNFQTLLILRVILGFVMAGLPAVAMAYLGEEIEPASLGVAMGLYISGHSIGGMGGRIITGVLTDFFNWRIALSAIGIVSLAASFLFWRTLPPSKNYHPRALDVGKLAKSMVSHLKDPALLCLYVIGFLLSGSFVSLYNYVGFQLTASPYLLSQAAVGWIFTVYLAGTFSSTWMGRLADKHGRRKVLWIAIFIMLMGAFTTLINDLLLKIIGIVIFTFAFFGCHSIASSWIGCRASHDKAQASSLYLFFFYSGSSIGGTLGGSFWTAYGWSGVIGMIACFLIVTIIISVRLSMITKLALIKQQNSFEKSNNFLNLK